MIISFFHAVFCAVSPLDENAPRFVKEAIAGYNETRRLRSGGTARLEAAWGTLELRD